MEEKLKEQIFMKALYLHLPEEVAEQVIKETTIYIQQEIDEACKKAKIEESEFWLKRFHGDYRRQETLDRIKELKEMK